jgi:adenylate cyclase class IV
MEYRYIRAIKSFCLDFMSLRKILIDLEASLLGRKDQTDYIFNIPQAPSKRLKLRYEDQKPRIIYYYDRNPVQEQDVTFQAWEVSDPTFKELFETVLGIRMVVQKRREVWQKDNIIFNLDEVAGVGNVFEVEFDLSQGDYDEAQVVYYNTLFQPYLGAAITGSNEDILEAGAHP